MGKAVGEVVTKEYLGAELREIRSEMREMRSDLRAEMNRIALIQGGAVLVGVGVIVTLVQIFGN